jgi:hypothetical protein
MNFLKCKIGSIALVLLIVFSACASSNRGSYKPKYKKPDPNKPLPCPTKDC